LTSLVDSLLNLSRVGRQPLTLVKIRLDDVLKAAWRELESETKDRKVEWQRSPLPTVDCDVGLMHIVFQNLLSNALKYSRTRNVAIITTGTLVENGRTVVFIQDNGVGYDPRFQEKLFGVFERLHGGTTFEGTGVGLAIVDRIIRKHGGRIWAKGEVDKGATFFFTLPGM
jgi:signal transduction histidine kinase